MSDKLKAAIDAAIANGDDPTDIAHDIRVRANWSPTAMALADEVEAYLIDEGHLDPLKGT